MRSTDCSFKECETLFPLKIVIFVIRNTQTTHLMDVKLYKINSQRYWAIKIFDLGMEIEEEKAKP